MISIAIRAACTTWARHSSSTVARLRTLNTLSLLKKSPINRPRQEITLPERPAEVQRDTLNVKAGEPVVSQLLDAPVPQRRFPLSPDLDFIQLKLRQPAYELGNA